jgi:hypothetical protein
LHFPIGFACLERLVGLKQQEYYYYTPLLLHHHLILDVVTSSYCFGHPSFLQTQCHPFGRRLPLSAVELIFATTLMPGFYWAHQMASSMVAHFVFVPLMLSFDYLFEVNHKHLFRYFSHSLQSRIILSLVFDGLD